MNCERIAELLPDYLQNALGAEQEDQVEDHLMKCAECKALVTMWNDLAALPEERPSPALHARFQTMLHAYQEGRLEKESGSRGGFFPGWLTGGWLRPVTALACAALLVVVGYSLGRAGNTGNNRSQEEIAAMHAELTNMRQLVVLSLLQQQSASERLQGIT